jgi:hypothetical protein
MTDDEQSAYADMIHMLDKIRLQIDNDVERVADFADDIGELLARARQGGNR